MFSILYVDDEPNLLEIAKIFLESTGELSVDTVLSAQQALGILKIHPYDAVLSDYQMPGMDGISFLREVRREFGDLPFILFTGKGREEVVIDAINNGADGYIQKGGEARSQFVELRQKLWQIITRKHAEDSLRETNAYLNNLITFAIGPMVTWDIDFKITRFNKAFETLTGFSEADVIGKDFDILFPDSTRKRSLDLICRALFGEMWESAEIPVRTARGDIRTVLWNSANLYGRDGKTLVATIAQGTDITERLTAEKELRESEEKFRSLVEYALGGILIVDFTGTILFANSSAGAIVDMEDFHRLTLTGNVFEFIAPESRESAIRDFGEVAGGTDGYEVVYTIFTRSGKKKRIGSIGKRIMFEGKPAILVSIREIPDDEEPVVLVPTNT